MDFVLGIAYLGFLFWMTRLREPGDYVVYVFIFGLGMLGLVTALNILS
jgi:hypothetical protein